MSGAEAGPPVRYEFGGRVALVTGAGSGIGRAAALLLAEAGARVAVLDRSAQAAESTAAAARAAGTEAYAVTADVSESADMDRAVAGMVARWGGLHLAVNSAGVGGPAVPVADYEPDDWRRVLAVNLDGTFYAMRAELRAMRAAGTGGSVVNVASIFATAGAPLAPAYTAAKHGVVGLTRSAALAHASDGIRVNAIGPGFVDTPMLRERSDEQARADLAGRHALGRLAAAGEVAALIAWLCSDAAGFVTGAFYPVDGGYLA